jgi:HAD superfamily hydrolase (TIGR01509 family)
MQLPAAVVFDCDGTLIDSERVTVAGMREALRQQGHTLTDEDVAEMVGHPWPRTRNRIVQRFGLTEEELESYRRTMIRLVRPQMQDDGLVFEDVVRTLAGLEQLGVPLAVCTSSGRQHLDRVLSLTPLRDTFVVSVAREDVVRHKPDPLPYHAAIDRLAAHLGVPLVAADVTVVEDSWAGVAAGVAAGCWTVAVDRGAGLHDLSHADVVVAQLDVDALCRIRAA